jgi:hypothetical protein
MKKMATIFENCPRRVRPSVASVSALVSMVLLAYATQAEVHAATAADFDLHISRLQSELPSSVGGSSTTSLKGAIIDVQNNRPWLELKNTSADAITEFNMTIPATHGGNRPFHFALLPQGLINVGANSSGVQITPGPPNTDDLHLTFEGDGLEPDEFIQFQIRFASDQHPNTGLPSFELALFNMCCDGEPMGSPSEVTVEFDDGDTFSGEWPEYPVSDYCIGEFGPPGDNPPTTYPFDDVIPEPSGALLVLLAVCGLAMSSASRGRRAA